MITNKKGQVTIFIILGIILLVSTALFFYIRANVVKPLSKERIAELPVEFQPVGSFVDYCLIKTTEDGLNILGDKAGYIYPEKYGISFSTDSTQADGIKLPGWEIPFWYYMKSDNDCGSECNFKFSAPTIRQMEEQLETYIAEELNKCLNDFNDFKIQGYDFDIEEEPSADVDIADEIRVLLNYNVMVSRTASTELDRFYITIPLDLRKIYNLGVSIMNNEVQEQYLELQTLNLITGFSGIDNEMLPPMADTEFSIGRGTVWSKSDVKDNLKNIVMSYTQFIQLYPSLNYRPYSGTSMQENLYNGMIVPSEQEYYDLEARFSYLGFCPMYLDLNCKGDICQPDEITITIIPTGFKRYNFVYDVSYPVIVEIKDPDALNKKGYSFRFGLEANIRDNEPFTPESSTIKPIDFIESDFCSYVTRNSGDITIKVIDAMTNSPIEDVSIIYSCGTESCNIGSTDDLGIAKQKFPICFGGTLSVLKEDYIGKILTLNTEVGKEENLIIELSPKINIKFEVKKLRLVKSGSGWFLEKNPYALGNEEATIIFTREGDEGFMTVGSYAGSQTEDSEISLSEGYYDVDINLMSYDRVVIPEEIVEYGPWWDEEEIELPSLEFNSSNPYISGAVLKDDPPNYQWHLKVDDLYYNDKIVFYAIYPDPRTMEDIRDYNPDIEYFSRYYRNAIEPRFE